MGHLVIQMTQPSDTTLQHHNCIKPINQTIACNSFELCRLRIYCQASELHQDAANSAWRCWPRTRKYCPLCAIVLRSASMQANNHLLQFLYFIRSLPILPLQPVHFILMHCTAVNCSEQLFPLLLKLVCMLMDAAHKQRQKPVGSLLSNIRAEVISCCSSVVNPTYSLFVVRQQICRRQHLFYSLQPGLF